MESNNNKRKYMGERERAGENLATRPFYQPPNYQQKKSTYFRFYTEHLTRTFLFRVKVKLFSFYFLFSPPISSQFTILYACLPRRRVQFSFSNFPPYQRKIKSHLTFSLLPFPPSLLGFFLFLLLLLWSREKRVEFEKT